MDSNSSASSEIWQLDRQGLVCVTLPLQRKLPTLKGLWESICSEVTTQLTLSMGFLRLQGVQYYQLRVPQLWGPQS